MMHGQTKIRKKSVSVKTQLYTDGRVFVFNTVTCLYLGHVIPKFTKIVNSTHLGIKLYNTLALQFCYMTAKLWLIKQGTAEE